MQIHEEETAKIIYAILFASSDPVPGNVFINQLNIPSDIFLKALDVLSEDLLKNSPLFLQEVDGSYALATRPEYGDYIKQAVGRRPLRLSDESMETLAIVAWNQPTTKAEIDRIRGGKDSDSTLATLVKLKLVEVIGEYDKPGAPLCYKTTKQFLRLFGLKSIADLPSVNF